VVSTKRKKAMSFIKNVVPSKGDLLRVKRKKGYYHYGIALDENTVIHFSGQNDDSITNIKDIKVRKAPLKLFVKDDKLEVNRPYDSPYSNEEVVNRAKCFLDSFEVNDSKYNLVKNNCEHFARYIYYGKSKSCQINSILKGTSLFMALSAVTISTLTIALNKKKKD